VAAEPEKEKAAVSAAEQWVSLVDQGETARAGRAAEYFRNAVKPEQWERSARARGSLLANSFQDR